MLPDGRRRRGDVGARADAARARRDRRGIGHDALRGDRPPHPTRRAPRSSRARGDARGRSTSPSPRPPSSPTTPSTSRRSGADGAHLRRSLPGSACRARQAWPSQARTASPRRPRCWASALTHAGIDPTVIVGATCNSPPTARPHRVPAGTRPSRRGRSPEAPGAARRGVRVQPLVPQPASDRRVDLQRRGRPPRHLRLARRGRAGVPQVRDAPAARRAGEAC